MSSVWLGKEDKMKNVTITDIAKATGFSIATVSNALNQRADMVSQENMEKIRKAAEEMGYRHKRRKTKRLCCAIFFIKEREYVDQNVFMQEMIQGMMEEADSQGYRLKLQYLDTYNYEEGLGKIDDPTKCDGILLACVQRSFLQSGTLKRIRVPFIVLDAYYPGIDANFVSINNTDGCYQATEYLIQQGHVNIGLIHPTDRLQNLEDRKVGFFAALADHRIEFEQANRLDLTIPRDIFLVDKMAYDDALEWMKRAKRRNKPMPTAFVGLNDFMTLPVMKAFQDQGYDISFIGFDDIPQSSPYLTTMRVDKQDNGKIAIRQLLMVMDYPMKTTRVILTSTELVIRQSVKKLK